MSNKLSSALTLPNGDTYLFKDPTYNCYSTELSTNGPIQLTVPYVTKLYQGLTLIVKFSQDITSGTLLNVNGLGESVMYFTCDQNDILEIVYIGDGWSPVIRPQNGSTEVLMSGLSGTYETKTFDVTGKKFLILSYTLPDYMEPTGTTYPGQDLNSWNTWFVVINKELTSTKKWFGVSNFYGAPYRVSLRLVGNTLYYTREGNANLYVKIIAFG